MGVRRKMLQLSFIALMSGLSGASSALEPLSNMLQSIDLVTAGTPMANMPFEWSAQTGDGIAGSLDVGLGSKFSDHFSISDQQPTFTLHVTPKHKDVQIRVRQRSVTYLNVSNEGPHIAIRDTDVASNWIELRPKSSTVFPVRDQMPQKLTMTRNQIVSAVKATNAGWEEVAKTCTSADEGACYTVTDTEFEIMVVKGNAPISRGVVRVLYPNGC